MSNINQKRMRPDHDVSELNSEDTIPDLSWEDLTLKFNLEPSKGFKQLPILTFPISFLPPSFHKEVTNYASMWLSVIPYERRASEAMRVRLLDMWNIPLCALFKGRLVENSKRAGPGPEYEVKHEFYTAGGTILLVFLKMDFKDEADYFAKALVELYSAYKRNSKTGLRPAVYAMWTDFQRFYFLCYDGQFSCTEPLFVSDSSHKTFFLGMMRVVEHLFSVLLKGFIGMADAMVARSRAGDTSEHNQACTGKDTPDEYMWSCVLANAYAAQNTLVCERGESVEAWEEEEIGSHGLSFLNQSISILPRVGFAGWEENLEP